MDEQIEDDNRTLSDEKVKGSVDPRREWLTANDVACELQISRNSVYRLVSAGKLRAHRVMGIVRYHRDDINRMLVPDPKN